MRGYLVTVLAVVLVVGGAAGPVGAVDGGTQAAAPSTSDGGTQTPAPSSVDAPATRDGDDGNESLLRHADDAQVTRTVTVADDASLAEMEYEVTVDGDDYESMREAASGDSVAGALAGDLLHDREAASAQREDVEHDGSYTLRITAVEVPDPERYGITLNQTDPQGDLPMFGSVIVYEDELDGHASLDAAVVDEVVYRAELPGQVMDTNADALDDGTATWTVTDGDRPDRLFVETGLGSDGVPGFGIGATLVGLALVALGLGRRSE